MNTILPPTVTEPPLTALAFLAEIHNVLVSAADDIPAAQCEWCAETDAVTRARVIGDPPPDSTAWAARDCCPACIEPVVRQAHEQQRDGSRHPIRLEVAA